MSNNNVYQQHRTVSGFKHWPIIEQARILWHRMQFTRSVKDVLSLAVFAIILVGIFLIINTYETKTWSDLGGVFFIYIATLMLALPPEYDKSNNNADELSKWKKRHVRVAVGIVIIGTMMQFSSYHLGMKQSANAKSESDAIQRRLNELTEANLKLQAEGKNASFRIKALEQEKKGD